MIIYWLINWFVFFFSLFDQIHTFYKIKASHGGIFEDLRPITVRHVYEQELVKLIPTRDNQGRRALWIETGSKYACNVQVVSFYSWVKYIYETYVMKITLFSAYFLFYW